MSEDADTVQQNPEDGDDGRTDAADDETASSLAERVAEYDEDLAAEITDLEKTVERLRAERREKADEVDELTARVKRVQADFKNYKERAKRRIEDEKARATEDLVTRLLDVRDNLDRALEDETEDVAALREGVELTRKEFDRVLDQEGVTEIRPDAGADADAQRHEVMMRVPSDESEGTVAEVYRPGYEMAGKVLRPAQVTVSDGSADEDESSATSDESNADESAE